jgi:hypothetical protein
MCTQVAAGARQCCIDGVLDTMLATLAKFSLPPDPAAPPSAVAALLATSRLAEAALAALFDIAGEHADALRHGWSTAIDTVMRLHVARLVDPSVFLDASVRSSWNLLL